MSALLAEYLPEGTEVVVYDNLLGEYIFGIVQRHATYQKETGTEANSPSNGPGVTTKNNPRLGWVVMSSVTILAINPSPKERMLWQLKGAK